MYYTDQGTKRKRLLMYISVISGMLSALMLIPLFMGFEGALVIGCVLYGIMVSFGLAGLLWPGR